MGTASSMGWAFLIGMAGAFVIFFMFIAEPIPLSPVEAYCRGAVDGRTSVIQSTQVYVPSDEELDLLEAQCVADPTALGGRTRGPLGTVE